MFTLGVTGAVSYTLAFLDSNIDTSARKWKGTVRELLAISGKSDEEIDKYYKGEVAFK